MPEMKTRKKPSGLVDLMKNEEPFLIIKCRAALRGELPGQDIYPDFGITVSTPGPFPRGLRVRPELLCVNGRGRTWRLNLRQCKKIVRLWDESFGKEKEPKQCEE